MPSINYKRDRTGGTIVWDKSDWLAGLSKQYTTSTLFPQLDGKLGASRNMNPFRYYGMLSPGMNPVDVTNVSIVDSYIRQGIVNSQYLYMISSGTKVHRGDLVASGTLANGTGNFAHTIAGTTVAGSSIEQYNIGTTTYGFFSYNDTGSGPPIGNIGRLTVGTATSTFIDDYLTNALYLNYATGLQSTVPHPLKRGSNDKLFVGDGNFLHQIDGQTGANGTFTAKKLTIPTGFIITTMARLPNFLVVFGYYSPAQSGSSYFAGRALAFIWDYSSLDPTYVKDLNDNYVDAAFEYNGTVGCFTSGRFTDPSNSRTSKLLLYNGLEFEAVEQFIGNPPIHGGVDVNGNMIQWNSQGIVHSYGSPFAGDQIGLNKIGEGSGSTSGMIFTANSTQTFLSTGTTTSGGLQVMTGGTDNFGSTTTVAPSLAEPEYPPFKKGKVRTVRVIYGAIASGGRSVSVTIADRTTSLATIQNAVSTVTAQNLTQQVIWDASSGVPLPVFDSIKPIIAYATGSGATTAPIIDRIEIDYFHVPL